MTGQPRALLTESALINRVQASGQRGPQPPSAHRTVRTGPYTAPHARRIHRLTSNQCGNCLSERMACPSSPMNQPTG